MKVLAALIINKVPAFGTAGCTNDDVLHFVTVQGHTGNMPRNPHCFFMALGRVFLGKVAKPGWVNDPLTLAGFS